MADCKEQIIDWRTLNLQTLDILLCSGAGKLSKQIQWFQRLRGFEPPAADISHIASLVHIPEDTAYILDTKIDPNNLYVTETTTLNEWCGKKGLQINSFSEWLPNYNGKVYVRQPQFARTLELVREVIKYIVNHLRDPNAQMYESGIPGMLELILCELGIKRSIIETTRLHCTEWVIELLKFFYLLADAISNNRMPPVECWNEVTQRGANKTTRLSLLDQHILVPISIPFRIK